MINSTTDNIECDICHADCGWENADGVTGADKDGVERDICFKCMMKHNLDSCVNCGRLFVRDRDTSEDCECIECRGKTPIEQGKIRRRLTLERNKPWLIYLKLDSHVRGIPLFLDVVGRDTSDVLNANTYIHQRAALPRGGVFVQYSKDLLATLQKEIDQAKQQEAP